MLIETPYKNGDTISLKLSSGEEVVARLEEERDDTLKLSKPLMLTPTQETGRQAQRQTTTLSSNGSWNITTCQVNNQ